MHENERENYSRIFDFRGGKKEERSSDDISKNLTRFH